ncbi:MAG: DUF1801 domain-containing protein [Burkholderiaceae bacterium]
MDAQVMTKAKRQSSSTPEMPANVQTVFNAYPPAVRRRFMQIRALMYQTAEQLKGVGPITETLKWGEPAYLTELSKSGSTVRFNWKAAQPDRLAVCFNCQSRLIGHFREHFPHQFDYEGNRALVLSLGESTPTDDLSKCLATALQYHRIKESL